MTSGLTALSLLLALGLAACSASYSDDPSGTGTGAASSRNRSQTQSGSAFRSIQQTVLMPACGRCHGGNTAQGGFSVASAEDMIDGGFVEPGDSAHSALCLVLKRGQMPPSGQKLSSATVKAICNWIDSGANP